MSEKPEKKAPNASPVVIDLMKLHSDIQKKVGGALSIHGISLSDYFVLHELSQSPLKKMRRGDLSEKVGLTPSGITRLLNPLEKIGLVEKEANIRDARVSLVSLTETGEKFYQDASVSFEAASAHHFKYLTNKQLEQLTRLLTLI